jgi:hypothetical protein
LLKKVSYVVPKSIAITKVGGPSPWVAISAQLTMVVRSGFGVFALDGREVVQ